MSARARSASFDRQTTETKIRGRFVIDGRGQYDVRTGIRFFDHMLELFARHGGFDLALHADGDLDVDQHHTVEDVGIVLDGVMLRSEEHTSELQSLTNLVCRLLLEKKKKLLIE